MEEPCRVLVLIEVADEGEVPLELAAGVAEEATVDQLVRSVREPSSRTFGLDVQPLRGRSRLDPRMYIDLYRQLGEVDLIHVHPNAVGAVARGLAVTRDVAIIKTEHNTHDHYGPVKNALNGLANAVSDVVVAVSRAVADSYRTWEEWLIDVGGGRAVVIHNGVDTTAIDAADSRRLPVDLPDGFLVGCGGYHGPQKNLSAVIEAVAQVVSTVPDVQLVVTGDGPKRAELEALAEARGVADRVLFTGYLDERADVHAVYHQLDMFAFPSRYEGFGVAAAEAMAAGVPVVASDLPVLREVVGDAGIYVDPAAPDELAAAIERLAADPAQRARLATAGKRRVDRCFRFETAVAAYTDLYTTVAAEAN